MLLGNGMPNYISVAVRDGKCYDWTAVAQFANAISKLKAQQSRP